MRSVKIKLKITTHFNRINPNRSIPTQQYWYGEMFRCCVSIVSIKTAQSRRLTRSYHLPYLKSFNRINPNRSIPTVPPKEVTRLIIWFQSYQSRQINPDQKKMRRWKWPVNSFNRINPDRSIPTSTWGDNSTETNSVSIVSIQTDQSRLCKIQTPTEKDFKFQSYQSRQINPDVDCPDTCISRIITFQSYQSKQNNPDFKKKV